MSDNVENAIFEILKSIQASVARLEARVEKLENRVDELDQRLSSKIDAIAAKVTKFQRDLAGTLVMMRTTVGDFDQRMTQLEGRVTALEQGRS